jgi:quercetin dioxygenase-like cupin family protein
MKFNRARSILFGALATTGVLWAANAQDPRPPAQDSPAPKVGGFPKPSSRSVNASTSDSLFVSADAAKFKEVAPGASMAVISGDPDKGAHRVFTKFAPGASFPLHTHTSEMHIVVIKGAYLYKPEKGEEQRVGPGCYLDIAANVRHSSGGEAKEGALFYEESAGKFDLVPAEKEKK